jgi:hypothetical protein
MKQTVNKYQFAEAFKTAGRGDQFSYKGLDALFDWLEEEDDGGYELDVIALCCDFSEYESAWRCATDYFTPSQYEELFANSKFDGKEERDESIREYFEENTCVIYPSNGGIIIQVF